MTKVVNGKAAINNTSAPSPHVQADFYAKLARLQSHVLTGTHPRYNLAKSDVEKLSSTWVQGQAAPTQTAPLPSPSQSPASRCTNGVAANSLSLQTQPLTASQNASTTVANGFHTHPSAQRQATHSANPLPTTYPLPPRPPVVQVPAYTRPAISQIDPVLLTKSDDLVRAEIRLKRQRIERSLKDAVDAKKSAESKKNQARDKDLDTWSGPHLFDGAHVLEAAVSLVKPASGLHDDVVNDARSDSSSLSNEYYSSKGNSWSPDEAKSAGVADIHQGVATVAPAVEQQVEQKLQRGRISGLGPGMSPVAPLPATVQRTEDKSDMTTHVADVTGSSESGQNDVMDTEESREESYSPPAAGAFSDTAGSQCFSTVVDSPCDHIATNFVQSADTEDRSRDSESYSPPPADFPVVQNRNPLPYAPQASRISPLLTGYQHQNEQQNGGNHQVNPFTTETRAQTRVARAERRRNRNALKEVRKGGSGRANNNKAKQAANAPAPKPSNPSNPRKRRREEEHHLAPPTQTNSRNEEYVPVALPRVETRIVDPRVPRAMHSPEPYIKAEPLSPPHRSQNTSTAEPPRRLVIHNDGRADLEVLSPRVALDPAIYARGHSYREVDPPRPSQLGPRRVDSAPIWIDSPGGPPPAVRRRLNREPTDLRRVASLQSMSRPRSPISQALPYPDDEVRYVRASSRMVDRPVYRQQVVYDDDDPVLVNHIRRARYTSTVPHYDDYPPSLPPRQMMPPPPPPKRRIFIDEDGNEFMAIPTSSLNRQSLALEPQYIDQRIPYDRDPYYEQPSRAPSRAMSHALEPAPPIRARSRMVETRDVHPTERQLVASRTQQIIEIMDDDDDDQRMPPPRLTVRKRVPITLDGQVDYDYYNSRSQSSHLMSGALQPPQDRYVAANVVQPPHEYTGLRAASVQPFPRSSVQPQQQRYAIADEFPAPQPRYVAANGLHPPQQRYVSAGESQIPPQRYAARGEWQGDDGIPQVRQRAYSVRRQVQPVYETAGDYESDDQWRRQ